MEELINILRGTLNPEQNKEAEQLLDDIKKIYKFCPNLLHISMRDDLDDAVRQAAAITLKNNVMENWQQLTNPTVYSIHEDDKSVIRSNILSAIINGSDMTRPFYLESLRFIIRYDFPGRWNTVPNEILAILSNDNEKDILNGYSCLLSLMRNFTYKKNNERAPLNDHMPQIMAKMHDHMNKLLNNDSEWSYKVKKAMIKIYFNYCQYTISFNIMSTEVFTYWLNVLCHIVNSELPADISNSPDLIWWKCKKWAIKTITSFNSRFSNPSSVSKQYKEFSMWFLSSCVETIIRTMFNVCEHYSSGKYVSPRVMSYAVSNFEHLIKNSNCWKYLKPHFQTLLKEILFKLLTHNEEDEEMWNEDPVEYVRNYYDVLSDPTPTYAATNVLKDVCAKRRGVLDEVMTFVTAILTSSESTVLQKDAAFRIIGEISALLLKKPNYASGLEAFLTNFGLPVFQAPEGFRRARICWLIGMLAEADFKNTEILIGISNNLIHLIGNDPELPVKIFALNALADLLVAKPDELKCVVLPYLNNLVLQCLNLLKESEVDELNDSLQSIISVFSVEFIPLVKDSIEHLKLTLIPMLREEISDQKEYVIIGMLSTIETLIKACEDHYEVIQTVEPLIVELIDVIFTNNVNEFYEEAYSLANSLTDQKISPIMWDVLIYLSKLIAKEPDEITDMMYLLSNYVTEDKPGLIAHPERINAIIEICKNIIETEEELDSFQSYGAKLLEMVLINYKGQIDGYFATIISIVIKRLVRPIEYSETKVMCLQVILTGFYYNLEMTLAILMSENWPGTNNLMIDEYLRLLFENISKFKGIHDRKMLIIGITSLLSLPADKRPVSLTQLSANLLPEIVKIMEGMKNTYENMKDEDTDYEDDDDDDSIRELGSDENEEQTEFNYFENFDEQQNGAVDLVANQQNEESDEDDDNNDLNDYTTELESFETELDNHEYELKEITHFYTVISSLSSTDKPWYDALVNSMTPENMNNLKKLIEYAEHKQKQIKEAGDVEKKNE